MLYQKECMKVFNDYFSAGALDRDVKAFIDSLRKKVMRGEWINCTIDNIEDDCGEWYSSEFGMRDFFYCTTVYYTITYKK